MSPAVVDALLANGELANLGSAGSDPVFGFQEPLANGLDLCGREGLTGVRSFEQVGVRTDAAEL